tara:strand:+ start:252 stop:383 length:132 start_codon:yes stop_codon:yes gene_type:complete
MSMWMMILAFVAGVVVSELGWVKLGWCMISFKCKAKSCPSKGD